MSNGFMAPGFDLLQWAIVCDEADFNRPGKRLEIGIAVANCQLDQVWKGVSVLCAVNKCAGFGK